MNNAVVPSVFDTQSLTTLKRGLSQDDPQALKAAARQFEAVFLQMVIKSMRAASPQEGMFDSEQTRFYQELLDSQWAQVLSAKGGTGLAAMIERQMSRAHDVDPAAVGEGGLPLMSVNPGLPFAPVSPKSLLPAEKDAGFPLRQLQEQIQRPSSQYNGSQKSVSSASTIQGRASQAEAFTRTLWPYAENAARQTGVPTKFLLAQAALETGWGKSEPRTKDGQPSHNLFGIKAGSNWSGSVAPATTSEYVNGKLVQRTENFRVYASYAESFEDYARLLTTQPRYAQVLGTRDAASFARALQNAGYATDPAYADKLTRVIGSFASGESAKG